MDKAALIRNSSPTHFWTSGTDGICEEAICITSLAALRGKQTDERCENSVTITCETPGGMRAKKCILHRSWNFVCVVV